MRLFLLNVLLAVLWMLMWGAFDIFTLLAGLLAGYLLLGLIGRVQSRGYAGRLWRLWRFVFYFIRILIKANLQVAWIVLHPRTPMAPRIVRYDVDGMTPTQITTLANCITLTPGTLVVDVSPDQRWLYVHCLAAADREQALRELDELRQRLMREVFQ